MRILLHTILIIIAFGVNLLSIKKLHDYSDNLNYALFMN